MTTDFDCVCFRTEKSRAFEQAICVIIYENLLSNVWLLLEAITIDHFNGCLFFDSCSIYSAISDLIDLELSESCVDLFDRETVV